MNLVEPLAVAANVAQILGTVTSVPPGNRRSGASRERRQDAYVEFQRSGHSLAASATHLRALAQTGKLSKADIATRALRVIGALFPDLSGLLADATAARMSRAIGLVGRMGLAQDLAGELLTQRAVHEAAAQARDAVAEYQTALSLVRIIGRPGPREHAENLTALLGELFGRIGGSDQSFSSCVLTIGVHHRNFILEVRKDLESRPWHRNTSTRTRRYQLWRPLAQNWPGGWPGPDAEALIAASAPPAEPTTPDKSPTQIHHEG